MVLYSKFPLCCAQNVCVIGGFYRKVCAKPSAVGWGGTRSESLLSDITPRIGWTVTAPDREKRDGRLLFLFIRTYVPERDAEVAAGCDDHLVIGRPRHGAAVGRRPFTDRASNRRRTHDEAGGLWTPEVDRIFTSIPGERGAESDLLRVV